MKQGWQTYILEADRFPNLEGEKCFELILLTELAHDYLTVVVNFILRALQLLVINVCLVSKEFL